MDKKSYKDILSYYIWYGNQDRGKALFIIFHKIKGFIEDSNGSKYLILIRNIRHSYNYLVCFLQKKIKNKYHPLIFLDECLYELAE